MTREKFTTLGKEQLIDLLMHFMVSDSKQVCTPSEVYTSLLAFISLEDCVTNEHFFSITLNGAHKVIDVHMVSKGLVNRTLVHPREVFRPAITDNAVAIVLAHNHPSGILEPSVEDLDVTRRIKEAGDLLGIKVLDHLIFSPTEYRSMAEHMEF